MAYTYPSQQRTIDPYSSFNSNVVNELTRMITRGENCLHNIHTIDVIIDSTSPLDTLIVSSGQCYKDDVIIELTDSYSVDMHDSDFYLDTNHFDETGYYYIVLKYSYVKSKPAPQASIRILKPSQRSLFAGGAYLLLKVVEVIFNGSSFEIATLYNYDPENIDVKRVFTRFYAGGEDSVPDTFNIEEDEGRLIYVRDKDELYFGTSDRWETFNAIRTNINTEACFLSQLVYVGADGKCYPAIATSPSTFSDAVAIQIGDVPSGAGKVRLYGKVEDVPIETGRTINVGDKLFLSDHEAGSISNFISQPYSQSIGTCIAVGVTTCTIWFSPGIASSGGQTTNESLYDRYQDLLLDSVFGKLFVDAFINDDYIDTNETTATIDTTNYQLVGVNGSVFKSLSLTDPSFSELCITNCQVSSVSSVEANVQWYASNNGNTDWEPITLDEIHIFSSVNIPTGGGSLLTVGEWVEGSISGKRGVLNLQALTGNVFLSSVTGSGNWINGELLTGDDSGNVVAIIGAAVERDTFIDLRVSCIWSGDCNIDDYGVLYDKDTIKDETSIENERNIETIYADMYLVPSLNNDGNRIFPFSDSVAIPDLGIVSRNATITEGIVELDNHVVNLELYNAPGFGEFLEGDTTPSVLSKHKTFLTSLDSTAAILLTFFEDAFAGQDINIVNIGSFPVTIESNSLVHLAAASDFVMDTYDVLSLIYISDIIGWVEKTRSNN